MQDLCDGAIGFHALLLSMEVEQGLLCAEQGEASQLHKEKNRKLRNESLSFVKCHCMALRLLWGRGLCNPLCEASISFQVHCGGYLHHRNPEPETSQKERLTRAQTLQRFVGWAPHLHVSPKAPRACKAGSLPWTANPPANPAS